MTRQQKLWEGAKVLLYSIRPLLAYLFVPGILMSFGMAVRRYGGSNTAFVSESGNFYNFVSCILILAWFYRRNKKQGKDFFAEISLDLKRPDRQELAYWGICLLFGASAGLFVSAVISLLPLPEGLLASYSESSSGIFLGRDWLLLALTVGILAPFTEETVFRGYMLSRLFPFFTEKQALILSAALFGLCHVNLLWVLYAFGMGLILGWIALKRENILYSIWIHMGFNLPSVLISAVQASEAGSQLIFGSRFLILLYGIIGGASGKLLYGYIKEKGD